MENIQIDQVNAEIFDPYLQVREKTAHRNEVHTVADRYSKMARLCLAQLNDLRQRQTTRQATIVQLTQFYEFANAQAERLWSIVVNLDTEITEEMERLQNAD